MSQENIADASKPNAGRIYDYVLGGSHNFEVDRQAAEHIIKLLPFIPKYARLQRWTLQNIAAELTEKRGYNVIVDFASGLPTEDHIHYNVPEGTIVIYSDYDPITVEYAHEILGDTPNVYYFEADATEPEKLLNNPQVKSLLTDDKKVAFVLWGVSAFINNDGLIHAVRYLHDWSGPDSCLVFNVQSLNRDDPTSQKFVEYYRSIGIPLHIRTSEECLDIVHPWQLDGDDFISLIDWHDFGQDELAEEDIHSFGPMGGGSGGYLIKA